MLGLVDQAELVEEPGPGAEVDRVDPGGGDLDAELTGARLGHRDLDDGDGLGLTRGDDDCGSHDLSSCGSS